MKITVVLLVTNVKVEKLHRQEIVNVEIAWQVFTRLKQGKDRVNRVNLVPGVIKSVVFRHQIANIVEKVPTQQLQLHHQIQLVMLAHRERIVKYLVQRTVQYVYHVKREKLHVLVQLFVQTV